MPLHDWTRVDAGIFHDSHLAWIGQLLQALNSGLLPDDYYALASYQIEPDYEAPFTDRPEQEVYADRRRTIIVYRGFDDGDAVTVRIDILSPAETADKPALDRFLARAASALQQGVHLLLVEPHPPARIAPDGVHAALWPMVTGKAAPLHDRLSAVSYNAGPPVDAYLHPLGVGGPLPDMPLFLTAEDFVNVPLERTYMAAYAGKARFYRDILEA